MTHSATNLATDPFPERYQILNLLASGGSGDAYLAWDSSLCREIVIKRVRTDSADEDVVQWIHAEAGKMAALKHPNIVAVYDVALSEGAPCIVMEHVIGQNLDDLVSSSGPLRLEVFVELAQQTLDALFTAHQAGMIHRDLKPSNVMISDLPSGSIQSKLLDFGLAKFIDIQAPSPQTVSIDGSIHGTTHYISPEQLSREPVGVHSDLYSLGCTLYFAVTGQPPFGGASVSEVITSHLSHLVSPPTDLRADLPLAVSEWLMRMIERHPMNRFSDALIALQALREAAVFDRILLTTTRSIPVSLNTAAVEIAESNMILPAPKFSWGSRRLLPLGLGLAAALMLGALLGWFGFGERGSNFRAAAVTPIAIRAVQNSLEQVPPAPLEPEPALVAVLEKETAVVVPPAIVEPPPVEPKITFRLVGSNTIGAELLPTLMEKFLEHMHATHVVREQRQKEETVVTFNLADSNERQAVLIQAHGSSTAFQALQKEDCEIGMSSRPIKSTEAEALHFLGDMLSPACEHVLGLDGLAVIVSRSNPIQALTLPQMAGIFSGEIRDWSELGGLPGPIHLYARDDLSGTYDSFRSLVLRDRLLAQNAERYEDSSALSDAVSSDAAGIGFIGLPYVRNSKAVAVSEPGAQALLPTPFSVATEDYVLSRRLFLYTAVVPKHPWTTSFTEFVLSDEGQKLVEESGFISQQVEIEKVSSDDGMPERYRHFAKTAAGRLSLSFRFRSGKTELDAKAVRDLDRVVRLLAKPENRRKQVCLLGFSDQSGSRSANLKISEERAKEISAQLALRGVPIAGILSMGSDMPVASNETKSGQDKNRRVEIWVGSL